MTTPTSCWRVGVGARLLVALALASIGGCDDGKTTDEYLASARTHRAAGEVSAAIIDLKNALQRDPKRSAARLLLAQLYLDLPDAVSAEAELQRARQDGAEKSALAQPLAQAELMLGKPELALKEAEPPADASPELKARLLAVAGEAYMALGRDKEALEAIDSGMKADPRSVDVLTAASRYAFATGDLATARKRLMEAQQGDPKRASLFDMAGTIEFAGQNYPASIKAYKDMLGVAPWSMLARLGLARAQIADGKLDEANAGLAAVLKMAPNEPRANYLRALAAYRQNEYAAAQSYAQRALSAAKGFAPALLMAGASSYALRQYEQANSYLSQYVYQVPQNVQARKLLAAVQLALGHSADAVKTLSPAVDKTSSDAQLLALIGAASAQSGDLAAASQYLSKALEQQPQNAAVRTELGITQVALGEIAAGIEALEEASREDPGAVRAEAALFVTYFQQKNFVKALEAAERLKKNRPHEPAGFDFAGAAYLAKGDESSARDEYVKARELRPGDAIASRSLAALAIRDGDLAAARGYYNDVLKANPKDAASALSLAAIEEHEGHRDGARTILESAIAQNPDSAVLRTVLGRAFVIDGKYQEALSAVEPGLAKYPRDPALLEVAGQAQLALGDTDAARGAFTTLTDVLPQLVAGHRYLAETYLAARNPDLAIGEASKAVAGEPADLAANLVLARAYFAKGSYAEAQKLLGQLAREHPKEALVADLQGTVSMAENHPSEAIKAFGEAVAARDVAAYRIHLAAAQSKAGQFEAARSTLSNWIDAHPNDAATRLALGDLYLQQKQAADAEAQYAAVLRQFPNSAVAENNIAWVLALEGKPDEALSHAKHAASLAPNAAQVLDTLGVVLMQTKQLDDALATLTKAAQAAPAVPEIQFHLAQALANSGNKVKARDVLRALLSTTAAFEDREQAQKLLRDLES
jgi:putative PEP-CTERM system TPR-repeat lipoprotein